MESKRNSTLSRRDILRLMAQVPMASYFAIKEPPSGPDSLPHPQDPILVAVVDRQHPVSETYIRDNIIPNLVALKGNLDIGEAPFPVKSEKIMAHKIITYDLEDMLSEMWNLGLRPYVGSGFRGISEQESAYRRVVRNDLVAPVLLSESGEKLSTSQHSLGLAVDLTAVSVNMAIGIDAGFEKTKEGVWLAENSWKYGFVQSYTNGHDAIVNESWHFIYVGKNIAGYYNELKKDGWSGDIFDLQLLYRS